MCDPKLNTDAIFKALGESWAVNAVAQLKHFHAHGICVAVARDMVVRSALAAAASAQATADATQNQVFNTDNLKKLLDEILTNKPLAFVSEQNGSLTPVTLN